MSERNAQRGNQPLRKSGRKHDSRAKYVETDGSTMNGCRRWYVALSIGKSAENSATLEDRVRSMLALAVATKTFEMQY